MPLLFAPRRRRVTISHFMPFRPICATLAAVVVLFAAASAGATADLRATQNQAQAVLAQIQALNDDVSAAAERFNGANYRLQQLSRELATTRRELERSRSMARVAQDRLAARLVQLYESDAAGALEVILGAETLAGVLDALEARDRVAKQDASIVAQVRGHRKRVAQRVAQLRHARAQQASVVRRRAAERASIEAKLAERQRLLGSVRAEITRLRAQDRARQAELARRARAALATGTQGSADADEGAQRHDDTGSRNATPAPGAPSAPAPPPADANRGAQVVAIAMRYLGVPYKWGGASPSTGFDCSGLTMFVYAQIGISLPHYAAAQYRMGRPVSRSQLQLGDLVFFRGLGHMGMYVGGGNYINAPQTGDVVKISSISARSDWVGARRLL
jgi:cell wall-associated NlpC family hydrolase